MADKHQLPPTVVFDTLDAAIAQTSPDLVFDVTIPGAHHDVTMTALKADCHVLGEKPLSDNLTHARQMVAAAANAGRVYAVMQNRRFDPHIRTVRKNLQQGAIGQVA